MSDFSRFRSFRDNNNLEIDSSSETTTKYLMKLIHNLDGLRHNQRFCDVEIIAENRIFHAHRAVLVASSLYFQAMFTGGLCEEDQSSVVLHGISADIFDLLLGFIYSGQLPLNQNNVQEVMIVADMLEIGEVFLECTNFLINELQAHNSAGIFRFAKDHNFEELTFEAQKYIETNFLAVSHEDELYELNKEEISIFLSSENLKIEAEYQVFKVAIRWFQYDLPERRQYVFDIMGHIRLTLIPFELLEKAANECNESSLKVALKSIHNDVVSHKGCLVKLDHKPRKCAKRYIYVIGGSKRELQNVWDKGLTTSYVQAERYDAFTGEWDKVLDMCVNRLVPGVALLHGQIYVVGGEHDTKILSSCKRFNPSDHSWTSIASMVVPRCEFGLCALNGRLYAMGGWVDTDISGSMEMYDPKLNRWDYIGDLAEPRFSMGLVAYHGLIYMVGGCSQNNRNLQDLSCYNPSTGQWKQLASMSIARFQMGVVILDDYLYVIGGTHKQDILNSVERYSFRKNKWKTMAPMKEERSGSAVAAMDGKIFVIGGAKTHSTTFYRAQCTIKSVECYDPRTNCWTECAPLLDTRYEAGAVVL